MRKEKNREYYFDIHSLAFCPNLRGMLLNEYLFPLSAAPLEKDEKLLVSLDDLKRAFAGVLEFTVVRDEVTAAGKSGAGRAPFYLENGLELVDVSALMLHFGWKRYEGFGPENMKTILLTEDKETTVFPRRFAMTMEVLVRGKKEGDLRRTFFFEEGGRVVPYHIYLPTCIEEGEKLPVIFWLHGGKGNAEQGFRLSKNMLQFYAEENRMIVVGVDGYIRDAAYGYPYPANPGDPDIDYSCPENPGHFSEERLERARLAERCLEETIKEILENYPADPDRKFLFGHSMGCIGTFWFASTHPDMFRALVACGAMLNPRLMDISPLKKQSILFVGGTEDGHGFDYLRNGIMYLEKEGFDIRHIYVGGGEHSDGWSLVLDRIYAFLKQHC
ncbi:MAG: esterase family protein [Clostridium sp.]|nr:esterase family protein [Clostridium sp.]